MNLSDYRKLMQHKDARRRAKEATKPKKPKGANATEAAFNRDILQGRGIFEAMSFKIAGGHRYTPDFIVSTPDGIEAYEVKGSYRFPSEGRARLAFDDARERYPAISFNWYRKTHAGWTDET